MLIWERPPNENNTLIEYEISVHGPGLGNGNYKTNFTQYDITNLSPSVNYTVSIRTLDILANISGEFTNPITASTLSGIPGPCERFQGTYINDASNNVNDTLDINWSPPKIHNGTIIQYVVIWSIDQNGDCSTFESIDRLSDNYFVDYIPSTDDYSKSYSVAKPTYADITIEVCIAAETAAGRGRWRTATVVGRVAGNTGEQVSQTEAMTALAVVSVVTVLAIAAAVVISLILLIVCCMGYKANKPSKVSTENGGLGETPKRFRFKKPRTPDRKQTESVRQIMKPENSI